MVDERRQCGAINSKGDHCHAWAVRGSEPPRCMFHITKKDVPAAQGPQAPLTVEEEIRGLTAEYRRLIHARKKSLETTRMILALAQAIKELGGLTPAAASRKDDPSWMKKFRPS